LLTDDVHFRNTTSRSFDPISPGLFLLRFDLDAPGAPSAGEPGDDRLERQKSYLLDGHRVEKRIGHACLHDVSASPQGDAKADSLVLRSVPCSLDTGISCTARLAGSIPPDGCRGPAFKSESSLAGSYGVSNSTAPQMNQFLIEFQKIRNIYNKVAFQNSGLICVTGMFEGCPFVRLHRDSWKTGPAEVFFSVWTDKASRDSGRIHYNIHALKMRQFKGHVISSRDFANNFRKNFKALSSSWPNIRVDYGPLNLMQGWIELRDESFERNVLGLMSQFAAVCPIIDQLLEERIAPVRQRR
jgi:hypothetical protein